MEVLHAVFHWALIRTDLNPAFVEQGLAPGIHSDRNLVVFHAGFHVRGLLRFNEFALEQCHFFGVIKLNYIDRFVD